MLTPFLIVLAIVLAGNVSFAESDEVTIVKKWAHAQKEVKTVRAEFLQYRFDNVFNTCQVIKGEVIFSSPTSGFVSNAPWLEKETLTTIKRAGKDYELKLFTDEAFIWSDCNLSIADMQKKEYQQCSLDESSFLCWLNLSSITSIMPFLPGMPDKKVFSEWSFKLVSENEKEIRLSAIPPKKSKTQFTSCDLILQKTDMKLSAVRYNHPGNNSSTVTIFTSAKRNPKELPSFDLCGYRKINLPPLHNSSPCTTMCTSRSLCFFAENQPCVSIIGILILLFY